MDGRHTISKTNTVRRGSGSPLVRLSPDERVA